MESILLNKSDKIFISSTLPGKNMDEILALEPYISYGFGMTLFYQGLEFNNVSNPKSSLYNPNEITENVGQYLNDDFITQSELDNLSFLNLIPILLLELDVIIYHLISFILVLIAFVSFIY